jgi:hypothetical protein
LSEQCDRGNEFSDRVKDFWAPVIATAIVDESDNPFIDSASNSAILRYNTETHFEWVSRPICDAVCRGILSVPGIRERLEKFDAERAASLTDEMIPTWILSAQ